MVIGQSEIVIVQVQLPSPKISISTSATSAKTTASAAMVTSTQVKNSLPTTIQSQPSNAESSTSTNTKQQSTVGQLLNSSCFSSGNNDEAVKCIFLCEFHVTAGRKITVQVPENYLSKEKFETVSHYVIPQVELQRSFLSLSLLGIKILGYPVRIDHKQYARNAFYFNICFVFSPATRTIGYEPVVKKLSDYLLSMEHSNRLLSQQNDAAQLGRLARILTQVRNDINSKGVCMLQEGSTLIPMCVVPRFLEAVKIGPHHAAALTDEFYNFVRNQWDLTTIRILPYINGFNHANRITALADVALELVCDCIRHLVVLGVAVLVPVFQYSNVYRPTPKLSQLAKCRLLQQKCIQRCSKSDRQSACVRDIFRIFASMAHGATFGELCVRFNPAVLNINEKKMVLFGQLEGLIRRVEKYPVTVKRDLFAEDVDNITKRKVGLVSGQIPNTPVFEQQSSITSNRPSTPNNCLKNNLQTSLLVALSNENSPIIHNNSSLPVSPQTEEAMPLFARKYKRLPSKPLPRSGRAAYRNENTSFQEFNHENSMCQHNVFNHNNNQLYCMDYQNTVNSNHQIQFNDTITDGSKNTRTNYNGLKSFDEICCSTGMSCQQLDYHLARDKHVIVLLK